MNKNIMWVIWIILIAIGAGLAYYVFMYKAPATNTNTNQPTNNNFMIQNMKVEVLKEGSGEAVKEGDRPTMNYTGWLENGTKFDSSLDPGRTPFQFTIGPNCALNGDCVIEGWNLGVTGMKVGEERKLTIPPELGYGAAGAGRVIPPNATLIFNVQLLKIN